MPSQENLKLKQAVIDEISEKMEKATSVVVIDYIGITVDQANSMRRKLRDAGVDYKVYKNTLARRAVEGTPNAELINVLEGPSAFAFGYEDAIAPARVLDGVIREFKKMEFKAGLVEGVYYDAEGIKQIAMIPSREVLIARFLGSIQSPLGKLVRTFAAIADAGAPAEETASLEETPPAAEAPAEETVPEAVPLEEAVPAEEMSAVEAPAEETVPEAAPLEEAVSTDETPAAAETLVEETVTETAPAEEAAPEK